MTLAEDILNQKDPVAALHQKRLEHVKSTRETRNLLSEAFHTAIQPLPKARNRFEMMTRIASNAFSVYQGVRTGMNIVRGIRFMMGSK